VKAGAIEQVVRSILATFTYVAAAAEADQVWGGAKILVTAIEDIWRPI
jgi:hypothetical protein